MRLFFRDKLGRFSRPRITRSVWNEEGQKLSGAAKTAAVKKAQKRRKTTRVSRKKGRATTRRAVRKPEGNRRASHAVPRELNNSSFRWFVVNLDSVPASGRRDLYALVELGQGAASLGGTLSATDASKAFKENWILPVKLSEMTIKEARSLTLNQVKDIVEEIGISPVDRVIAVVAKKTDTEVRGTQRNNPLINSRKTFFREKRKAAIKAKDAKRKTTARTRLRRKVGKR